MEYTFKNSLSNTTTTVVLSEYSLSVLTEGKETLVPYANILSVRLTRSGKKFCTIIKPTDQPEISISIIQHAVDDESTAQYATFVRVLHYHLREKSMANYVCGNNLKIILLSACASVLAAFAIPHLITDLGFYQRNLVALALSIVSMMVIAIVNWGHFPNVYKPENIPLQFLPAA